MRNKSRQLRIAACLLLLAQNLFVADAHSQADPPADAATERTSESDAGSSSGTTNATADGTNESSGTDGPGNTPTAPADGLMSKRVGRPFSATLKIETPKPIGYDDEIVVSVRVVPNRNFYLRDVILSAQGPLADRYPPPGAVPAQVCAFGGPAAQDLGKELEVTCRLRPYQSDAKKKWWNDENLLDPKQLRLQVEFQVNVRPNQNVAYFVYGDTEVVSPKSHVVLGGFLGAALWAVFLALSPLSAGATAPAGSKAGPLPASTEPGESQTPPKAENPRSLPDSLPAATPGLSSDWSQFRNRLLRELPPAALNLLALSWTVVRQAAVGGLTALVLIVVAKGTEGMQPPISIRIQDFWGGLMIGILSAPLAKWLRAKFSDL